ncbi:alpha/beta fold hydrolase [Streptomyces johnsoniae]|uniref:Alpha/beta hydrolase n=1 Tax=Streptomyces johnsoniae TaxID=3075532 RepID=A0ABU2S845_9ACTN|nr:alpha/beta hydrolase [Streptomyces sp. DSM 41886]MDT0445152.1 alpha/beta hydrolase [Streptomyces sp. DSM 41886]
MTDQHTRTAAPLVRGQGPGLLLAHGAGSDIQDSFGPVLDALAKSRTLVGPDYPGSGTTPSAAGPLTLDGLADHIVESSVRAGVHSFAISGFSMGTTVAVRAAIRHPERVTALVLSAGFARPSPRLRLAIDTWRALVESGGDNRTLAAYLSLVVGSVDWLEDRSQDELEEQVRLFSQGLPPGTAQQLKLLNTIDVRADLPRIRVPVLVVSPHGDLLTTPVHSRELAAGIPGARLVSVDSGHAIAAERPGPWAALITEFLDAVGH